MRLGILAPSRFCNGHVYFVQRLPLSLRLHPYAVHNTFQLYGALGKAIRFKENHLWFIEPDRWGAGRVGALGGMEIEGKLGVRNIGGKVRK